MHLKIIKSDPRAREKPCLRCGLSLRKLLDAKHCPRCGLSVWLSLNQNDAIDWSNPTWLRFLSIGAAIVAIAQAIALAAYAMLMLPAAGPLEKRLPWAALLGGIYLVAYAIGMLMMCRNERRYPDRLGGYRLAAQVVAVLAIVIGAALCWRGASRFSTGWPVHYPDVAQSLPADFDPELIEEQLGYNPLAPRPQGWLTLAKLVLAASAVSTFAYVRKLAQRIPNATMARMCGYVLFVPLIPFLKAFPIIGALLVWRYFDAVINLLPILYYPFTALLLAWFAATVHRSIGHATTAWVKETAAPTTSPPPAA
jgi:hypothetical protein